MTTSVGGGAIITIGAASVTNSTFIGNTAAINGGAINVQGDATLTLIDDTFFDNSSDGLAARFRTLAP